MDVARGLVEWVNTFRLSRPVESLEELSDGVALFEIMAEIDPSRFQMSAIKTDASGNWVLKESNLKKLHKLILQHYEENLGQVAASFDSVDIKAIASNGDEAELIKITQMVLGCVVQSENNQEYIERITTLEQSSQGVLMMMIQEIMSKSQRDSAIEHRARSFSTTSDTAVETFRVEYQQLLREKGDLEKENEKLQKRLRDIEFEKDELSDAREELKNKVAELEDNLSQQAESGKQDTKLLAEIDNWNAEFTKSEHKRVEAEKLVAKQNAAIADMTKKIEVLTRQAEEGQSLKERLEELKHVSAKLERAEAAIEKYKQKLEESAELKKQLKTTQSERDELLSRNKDLEELVSKNSGTKSQLSGLKEQIQALEAKNRDLDMERTRLAYESEKYKTESESLRNENLRYREEMEGLQERVNELEHTGESLGSALEQPSGIATEIYDKQIAELKLKVTKLERDNQMLRSSSTATSSDKEATLNVLLDEAKQNKEALEQNLREETSKGLRLADQVKNLEKKLQETETKLLNLNMKASEADLATEQLATAEREVKNLQMKVSESEIELAEARRRLRSTEEALQEKQKEVVSLKSEIQLTSKDKKEMMDAFRVQMEGELADKISATEKALEAKKQEFEELSQKYATLESQLDDAKEELKTKEEEAKNMIITVNALQSQNLALLEKKLESKDEASEGRMKDADKLELAAKRILEVQNEKLQLQNALKKAKMYIEVQEKRLKEQAIKVTELSNQQESTSKTNFPEAVRSLETTIAQKEQDIERLERVLKEQREAFKKEQRLMVSAWYSLGLQVKQKGPAGKTTNKQSWLGQQRQSRQLNRGTPAKSN